MCGLLTSFHSGNADDVLLFAVFVLTLSASASVPLRVISALLVAPIVNRTAEMVVGARPIDTIEHFSLTKRYLQRLGSGAVRMASGTPATYGELGEQLRRAALSVPLNIAERQRQIRARRPPVLCHRPRLGPRMRRDSRRVSRAVRRPRRRPRGPRRSPGANRLDANANVPPAPFAPIAASTALTT